MKLTNKKIYFLSKKLNKVFKDADERLPLKLAFCISKNKKLLSSLEDEIEEERVKILTKYGKYEKDDDSYHFSEEDKNFVNNELQDLLDLEQEVNLMTIKYNDLENKDIHLTVDQMDAIMFMVEEDKKEE